MRLKLLFMVVNIAGTMQLFAFSAQEKSEAIQNIQEKIIGLNEHYFTTIEHHDCCHKSGKLTDYNPFEEISEDELLCECEQHERNVLKEAEEDIKKLPFSLDEELLDAYFFDFMVDSQEKTLLGDHLIGAILAKEMIKRYPCSYYSLFKTILEKGGPLTEYHVAMYLCRNQRGCNLLQRYSNERKINLDRINKEPAYKRPVYCILRTIQKIREGRYKRRDIPWQSTEAACDDFERLLKTSYCDPEITKAREKQSPMTIVEWLSKSKRVAKDDQPRFIYLSDVLRSKRYKPIADCFSNIRDKASDVDFITHSR